MWFFSLPAGIRVEVGRTEKREDAILFFPLITSFPSPTWVPNHDIQKESSLCWECSFLPPSHLGNFSSCKAHLTFCLPKALPYHQERERGPLLCSHGPLCISCHFKVTWLYAWPLRGGKVGEWSVHRVSSAPSSTVSTWQGPRDTTGALNWRACRSVAPDLVYTWSSYLSICVEANNTRVWIIWIAPEHGTRCMDLSSVAERLKQHKFHGIHQCLLWTSPTLITSTGITLILAVGSSTPKKEQDLFCRFYF